MTTSTTALWIVEVEDQCAQPLVGHDGCAYTSPPQPSLQALALVRVLLGCPQRDLDLADQQWTCAVAGGKRVIRLHPADAAGQLTLADPTTTP